GVGDDVVEAGVALLRDLVPQGGHRPVPPQPGGAPGHEQQEGPVLLDGEAADGVAPAVVAALVVPGGGVVAVEVARGDVHPVEAALGGVPQGPLPGDAGVVGDQLWLNAHRVPPGGMVIAERYRRPADPGSMSR